MLIFSPESSSVAGRETGTLGLFALPLHRPSQRTDADPVVVAEHFEQSRAPDLHFEPTFVRSDAIGSRRLRNNYNTKLRQTR